MPPTIATFPLALPTPLQCSDCRDGVARPEADSWVCTTCGAMWPFDGDVLLELAYAGAPPISAQKG